MNIWTYVLIPGAILAITVIAAAISAASKHRDKVMSPINIMFVGVFLASFLVFCPVYANEFRGDIRGVFDIKTFLVSVHNAIKLFVVDSDYQSVIDAIGKNRGIAAAAYSVLCAILFVLAPLLTFGFILSFFKNLTAYRRYLFSFSKDAYIFSELNSKSMALARDIKENHKSAVIVFTDVSQDRESDIYELAEQAQELGAICFSRDILSVRFDIHSKAKKLIFLTVDDENDSLKLSLGLIRKYGLRQKTELFAFSTCIESELLLNAANKNLNMKVRRINPVRSLTYDIIDKSGENIFRSARDCENGKKLISAIVVGMGEYGFEMTKALTWLCQMPGYELKLNVFDSDEAAERRFLMNCPELVRGDDSTHPENRYDITIHPGIEINTAEFMQELEKIGAVTYAFVSLGDDTQNIETAVRLRSVLLNAGYSPMIQAVVYDSEKKELLCGVGNFENPPTLYNIDYVGDLRSIYSEEAVLSTELERFALGRHMRYGSEESFWAYEYNYRSSMASAIHIEMCKRLAIPGADKAPSERTPEELDVLRRTEHSRWNAYMRSEGYRRGPKNHMAKTHAMLVPFDELPLSEQEKDDA